MPSSSGPRTPPLSEDFRRRLVARSVTPRARLFAPLEIGNFVVSIQASAAHACRPRENCPVEAVEAWEVAIFQAGGWVTPRSHPELFLEPAWERRWIAGGAEGAPAGAEVPTEVVQVLLDIMHHGRDHYDAVIGLHRFMSLRVPRGAPLPPSTDWF